MISVWRIDKAKRSRQDSFSGNGASIEGGRWNHAGIRMVYASETLSLAAWEKFVHMGDEGRSLKLASYKIEIPPDIRIEELSRKDLPSNGEAIPAPKSTKDIGTEWVKRMRSAILKVPSVTITMEHNYLLNPLHPDFKSLKISAPEPFQFDTRLGMADL